MKTIESPWSIRFYGLTRGEKLFLMLFAVVGLSQAEAYQLAFQSDASLNSCSAMASRMLRENRMLAGIGLLNAHGVSLSSKARKYINLIGG